MNTSQLKIAAGFTIACIGICIYSYLKKEDLKTKKAEFEARQKQIELDILEEQTKFPPEYWTAKQVETTASAKKYEIDVASKERLEIDARDRRDAEAAAKREFEKDAPEAYWAQKKVEEEERTRRHQMDLDDHRMRRQAEADRDIAKRNAEALESSAKAIERAIRRANGDYAYIM